MKYYIVDDVLSIVKILNRIIEQKDLGEVIGFSTDAEVALAEIVALNPDIVLVDLLMPVKDGISLVSEVKKLRSNINFIMISQVSNKEMISDSYRAGVEFFIHKPINIIEVENVIKKVAEKIQMETMLSGIKGLFQESSTVKTRTIKKDPLKDVKYLLGVLGMLGERGTKDILAICEECLIMGKPYDRQTIALYCNGINEDVKMVKQRMRRAVKKGLANIANMGMEDYYSEVFQSYSQLVFDFESIRAEMGHIRGQNYSGGKANLDKFLEGLLIFSEMNC
ncbi:DNA-binding domain-containing protein [Anaerovorax sp. IOR16]|uniref:DNA-binding domain-containing protein n=1 Tax=Anaerovorax sp. IOR16 TaxID=2773458 RepID=UPI0019D0A438|nr:DNA-binding domain-containing protein [Anaerovorax sp. IOR16]